MQLSKSRVMKIQLTKNKGTRLASHNLHSHPREISLVANVIGRLFHPVALHLDPCDQSLCNTTVIPKNPV